MDRVAPRESLRALQVVGLGGSFKPIIRSPSTIYPYRVYLNGLKHSAMRCTTEVQMNKLTKITRLALVPALGTLALTSCAEPGDDETAPESAPTPDQVQTDTPKQRARRPGPPAHG